MFQPIDWGAFSASVVVVLGMCFSPSEAPMPDWTYPAPRDLIRRAANTIPTASDRISRSIRTDVPLDSDISEVELVQYRLERELRDAQARIRALEGTLHCVAKVVKPYLPPNGRP